VRERDPSRDWLQRGNARRRPWAFEEELIGQGPTRARKDELDLLAARLREEEDELSRTLQELRDRTLRVARLEERLRRLESELGAGKRENGSTPADGRRTVDPHRSGGSLGRGYWLSRCEGFEVESPAGHVGTVEGLRFRSRLDQPDHLEIRAGRFGRQLLVVPVEDVEVVLSDEELVVLRRPPDGGEQGRDLLADLRDKLSASRA
jgi:hypothetical protein